MCYMIDEVIGVVLGSEHMRRDGPPRGSEIYRQVYLGFDATTRDVLLKQPALIFFFFFAWLVGHSVEWSYMYYVRAFIE